MQNFKNMEKSLANSDGSSMGFGAIAAGALICLVLQIALFFLASGVGLSLFKLGTGRMPDQAIGIAGLIYGIGAVVGTFLLCGYVVSVLSQQKARLNAVLYGLTSWALVEVTVVGLVGTQILSSLEGIVAHTETTASSVASLDLAINAFRKMNPRIISDIKLTEGKVVSQLVLDHPKPTQSIDQTSQEISKEFNNRTQQAGIKGAAESVKRGISTGSLVVFFGLFIGAMSTGVGSILGRRRFANQIGI